MTISPEKIAEMLGDVTDDVAVMHNRVLNASIPTGYKSTLIDQLGPIHDKLTTLRSQLSGITDETSSWQPIKTAPRDGTAVIVRGWYVNPDVNLVILAAAAVFLNGIWWRDNDGYGFTVSCVPTHWQPLPPLRSEPIHDQS